jgi:multidrug efflux pump subunit AcrB
LIVEVARERRIFDGKPIIDAAREAARARFRPILCVPKTSNPTIVVMKSAKDGA